MSPHPHRNVVICGLTAAGKTTHAKRLAVALGYEYVSGTGTLARLLGIPVTEDPPRWAHISAEIASRRTDNTDRDLERELLRRASERDRQVFDVWALPWTSQDPALIRIWIDSTLETRTWKSFVSQGELPTQSLEECRVFVQEKDDFNRSLFLRMLGFDLYTSRSVFNVCLDNSSVITEPTAAASQRGIEQFEPIVRAAFDVCHGFAPLSDLLERDKQLTGGCTVVTLNCDAAPGDQPQRN